MISAGADVAMPVKQRPGETRSAVEPASHHLDDSSQVLERLSGFVEFVVAQGDAVEQRRRRSQQLDGVLKLCLRLSAQHACRSRLIVRASVHAHGTTTKAQNARQLIRPTFPLGTAATSRCSATSVPLRKPPTALAAQQRTGTCPLCRGCSPRSVRTHRSATASPAAWRGTPASGRARMQWPS